MSRARLIKVFYTGEGLYPSLAVAVPDSGFAMTVRPCVFKAPPFHVAYAPSRCVRVLNGPREGFIIPVYSAAPNERRAGCWSGGFGDAAEETVSLMDGRRGLRVRRIPAPSSESAREFYSVCENDLDCEGPPVTVILRSFLKSYWRIKK